MESRGGEGTIRLGAITMYRWLPRTAEYRPDEPWPGGGRFGDGVTKMLYVAMSPQGAVAEFYRSHPEFIPLAKHVDIRIFVLTLMVEGECVDVRTEALADIAGIAFERLRSCDRDVEDRYAECRLLGQRALHAGRTGITYPAAAAVWDAWNMVLFHEQRPGWWECTGSDAVGIPDVPAGTVRLIDSGA